MKYVGSPFMYEDFMLHAAVVVLTVIGLLCLCRIDQMRRRRRSKLTGSKGNAANKGAAGHSSLKEPLSRQSAPLQRNEHSKVCVLNKFGKKIDI